MMHSNLRCSRYDIYKLTHIHVHLFGILKSFFVYFHTEVHLNDIDISAKAYTTKLQSNLLFLAFMPP